MKFVLLLITTLCAFGQNRTLEADGNLEIVPVRNHIYLLADGGANIAISAGKDGVLLVDTGDPKYSDKIIAAVRKLSHDLSVAGQPRSTFVPDKPIRYIINTTAQPDHAGGNEKLARAGKTFTGGNVAGDLGDVAEGAAILAHEETLQRLTDADRKSVV